MGKFVIGFGSHWTNVLLVICVLSALSSSVRSQRNTGDPCKIRGTGVRGICRPLRECSSARRAYENQRIRPTSCGYFGNTPIVCCVEEGGSTSATTRRPLNYATASKRISEIKCEEYTSSVTENLQVLTLSLDATPMTIKTDKCDFGGTELIVGGQDAKLGEYPHMALIGWEKQNGQYYDWKCAGTLISEKYVLSSAHCSFSEEGENTGYPSIVRLGEHNLASNTDGANPIDIRIRSIINHPGYKLPSTYNDICLFLLDNSVILSNFIRPACLWIKPNLESSKVTATGWGDTSYLGSRSDILQKVTLNVIDSYTCSSFFPRTVSLRKGINSDQLCAGNLTGGSDTCQGDSGGPLQVSPKSNRCIHYVVGITSFGKGCGSANSAGIYTRVSSYVDWIEKIVWRNN